jgi:hypothetical protein
LAGEPDAAAGQRARRQLEARVVAQRIEIVGILVAAGNRQDPRLKDVGNTVDDTALVAAIGNATGQTPGNAHRAFRLRQQQHARIRCQPPAIERRRHCLAANGWKSKTGNAIVDHGGRGTFCPVFKTGINNLSPHQISRLSYARQPKMDRQVNNSG